MNAKRTDLGKMQEIFDVITQTQQQIKAVGITKKSFLHPADDTQDLVAEGIDLL